MIPRRSSPLRRAGAVALALAAALLVGGPAQAEEAPARSGREAPSSSGPEGPSSSGPEGPSRVGLEVGVHYVSQRPGPVDPAAQALERKLRQDFRFQSIRVLDRRRLDLALNETGTVDLPSGRRLKVKPRRIGPDGLFMRVEVEGMLRTSLRVPNHHQVVIGTERYEDGKLVVTLEPDY